MTADTKECPFCAETIKAAAKKCKHCGEWLDGHTRESALRDYVGGDKISTGDMSEVKGAGIGERAQGLSAGDVGGSVYQAQGDISLGKELRDEQYYIALNWVGQGKPLMRGFDLSERNLSGVYLSGADLRGVNLYKTNLHGADLRFAYLFQADLREADLRKSYLGWFRQKPLTGTGKMHGSREITMQRQSVLRNWPRGSKVTGAILAMADLSGANLEGADLEKVNLSEAKYTIYTIWPDRFDPKAAGAILVDNKGKPK